MVGWMSVVVFSVSPRLCGGWVGGWYHLRMANKDQNNKKQSVSNKPKLTPKEKKERKVKREARKDAK